MRAAIASVACLLLLALPAVAQPPDDKLIVPGVRIGTWRVGASVDDLVHLHGKPTLRNTFKDFPVDADFLRDGLEYLWYGPDTDMAVFTFGRPVAEELEVGRHGTPLPYRTAKGVRLNSIQADILKAYGKPTSRSIPQSGHARLIYDGVGIAFWVQESTGWVVSIAIFKPGSARQIWKF